MFRYSNLNPQSNRVGDCVIRAIAKAMGETWETTYIELCLQGYLMSDLPSSNAVWDSYLKGKGFTRGIVSTDCRTIADFADEYNRGVYVVGTGTHAVAVIDGVVWDNWDSSGEQPIYFYHKGERTE